jgi:hypothetical protein
MARADTTLKKDILERLRSFEDAFRRAREYLESGKHAYWVGLRPAFSDQIRGAKSVPPHKDWVRNVLCSSNGESVKLQLKSSWRSSTNTTHAGLSDISPPVT